MERHRMSVVDKPERPRLQPPRSWERLSEQYPEVAAAYKTLTALKSDDSPGVFIRGA